MKFVYYNDTKRIVSIHPATLTHGCEVDMKGIEPLEERTFILPEDTYPWVKMWDYGTCLQILVSPRSLTNDTVITHEPIDISNINPRILESMERIFNKEQKHIEVEPKETRKVVFKKKVDYTNDPFKEEK